MRNKRADCAIDPTQLSEFFGDETVGSSNDKRALMKMKKKNVA